MQLNPGSDYISFYLVITITHSKTITQKPANCISNRSFKRHQFPELLPRFVPNKSHIILAGATVRRHDRQVVILSRDHLALSFDDFHKLESRMGLLVVLIDCELCDIHHRRVGHIWNRLPSACECPFA
ncbi:hypothetical protein Hanom_Chr07g00584221 [Helianthus anomalus]